MFRSTLTALGFAATLWAFASLDMIGEPVLRAALAVALGVGVTALAYGQVAFVSVSAGALSPLALALLARHSLALATAALCLVWLVPRFVLADRRRLPLLVIASVGAALASGFVVAAHVDTGWAAEGAACIFAGSCLSLVGLVPTETGVAWALRSAALVIESPARTALERAARAHARRDARTSKSKSWRALVRLADQRAALVRAQDRNDEPARKDLDDRIVALAEELAPPDSSVAPPAREPEPTEANASAIITEHPADTPPEVSCEIDARDRETAAE